MRPHGSTHDHASHAMEEAAGGNVLFEAMRGSLDHCVKCTICETACPFSNVTPLFPGPKYVGPQAERFRTDEPVPDASVDYCSSCGICTQVCPHGVHIAEINTITKARLRERDGIPLRERLIARPTVLGRLGTPAAPIANWTLRSRPIRLLIEKTMGIHRDAAMPQFAGRTFQAWARKHRAPAAAKRVVYFHGCGANYYEPRVGEMAVAVLAHNGFAVDVPKQDCCGLPLQSNGMFDDARGYVRRLVGNLAPAAGSDAVIVGTSTSCTLMLKREAKEILGMEGEPELEQVSARTYDIVEFLLELHERGELATDFKPVDLTVTYHAPCQQQGHGIGKPALDLMALVPGLRVIENDAACCGVAGTYGLKKEKYPISMDVGAPLFAQIERAAPDLAVCDSETCRWHIEKATGVRSVHPVEVLHRAYGLQ
ncbi:MAG: glycerol-3-phosphate dehydrogenase subunit [Solirubrobacteraceae bacterium]|nr:glycerol-3-phosphate dehydrogenase subunit [Solirubrobacteraceae bacterium]